MIDTKVLVTFKKKYPVTALVVKAIIETPVANPSKPSIRLTALVIARIQIMVIGKLSQPSGITPKNGKVNVVILTLATKNTTSAAKKIPNIFCRGFNS